MKSGICIQEAPIVDDIKQFGDNSTEDVVFDASQYAFFGKDVVQEVDLGGLQEEEEDLPAVEFDEEGEDVRSPSGIDDFVSTFSKLNKVVSEPRNVGIIGDGESREIKCGELDKFDF